MGTAKALLAMAEGEKPHSSISDWVEILTSDRYEEDSYDGVNELLESIRIQGMDGVTESSRAIRKKLKYGNVHRQLRALTLLRALSENGGKGYKATFANEQLLQRLKDMATDSLVDPKVKRKLLSVFHSWKLAFGEDGRNKQLAGLYDQYSGKKVIRQTPSAPAAPASPRTSMSSSAPVRKPTGEFNDLEHSWVPTKGHATSAADYADLAAKKDEAERRRAEREARSALEAREAEVERRERAIKLKQEEKEKAEAYRRQLADQDMKRRAEKERERLEKERKKNQPKRPPFDYAREKPQIQLAIANASSAAIALVNACRHVNRQQESMLENLKVQDALEECKVVRRPIIRYIQVVTDEVMVGVLLDANEKIVEAIQLYDKMSKSADLDSDSEDEATAKARADRAKDADALAKKLEAQKIEEQRTGEVWKMQQRQKYESDRRVQKRTNSSRLPPPMTPDDLGDDHRRTLSDYSDYDSSDSEYQARVASRSQSRRGSMAAKKPAYDPLSEDEAETPAAGGDPNDPFADPTDFLGSIGGSSGSKSRGKERMEWAAI